MSAHPESRELQDFRQRRLPPAAMLRIDQHLLGCADCRVQLAVSSDAHRDRAVLRRVVQSGAHLAFEPMQSYVDGRLAAPQRAAVEAHTTLCPMCRRELVDLVQHAPALRQALPVAAAPPAPAWRRWFGMMPALAVAGFVGAVAITVVVQQRQAESPQASMRSAPAADALDHGALERLEPLSPAAAEAWRRRDLAQLVTLLQALAEQRQPLALSALASLHAQGLGVPKDLRQAEQLWQRAADLGEPTARHNVVILRKR